LGEEAMPRFTIDLPDEINLRLTEIARENGITKAEAMRRAFALLSVAEEQKKFGRGLGIISQKDGDHAEVYGRILGI
jgi:predicted transcriptional regulator